MTTRYRHRKDVSNMYILRHTYRIEGSFRFNLDILVAGAWSVDVTLVKLQSRGESC